MSASYPSSSIGISFQSLSESAQAASADASLSLDDKKNLLVYGESRTSFLVGETAYLKLHCSEPGYSLDCSAGFIAKDIENIAYPYEQDIAFALSRSGDLDQVPHGAVNCQWMGKDGGTPLFSGKTVTIPASRTSILRCEYSSLGDRLKLMVKSTDTGVHASMDVLVVVHKDGKVLASMTVSYENEAIAVPVPVELSVADFCSDEQVEGVSVFLDGSFMGTTDASGKIFLGNLIPGNTYELAMVKEGYTESGSDVLRNDGFTVQKE